VCKGCLSDLDVEKGIPKLKYQKEMDGNSDDLHYDTPFVLLLRMIFNPEFATEFVSSLLCSAFIVFVCLSVRFRVP